MLETYVRSKFTWARLNVSQFAGFDDYEIFDGVKDSEDETGDENTGNH